MFLRVWISKSFSDFRIPNEEVPIFLEKLNLLLRKYLTEPLPEASPKHFNDLLIVLKAHSKAIKVYSLTKYDCFGEVLTILKFLPEKISHWHPVEGSEDQPLDIAEYILTLCRLIYRTIRIENSENATVFARTKGIEVFLLILDSLVHRINVAKNMENYNYYADMQISYEDLKILDLIIRIIVKMLQKCYSELATLDHDVKLKLFMNLLTVSKIPLILFEHVRNINIRSKSGKLEEEKSSLGKSKITPFDKVEEEPENEDEVIEVYSPESTSVFDLITSQPESSEADVCIMKIFIISKNLLDLLAECSIDAPFITTFVQSGLVWRFLEFLTYYNDIGEVSASNNNPNYQTMLINIEKICNIVRNLVMYGNDAFVWKIAGASNESSVDIIVASQEHQSSEVSRILTKIDSSEKLLLCQFFECVMQLLGKRLTQVLMSNYTQPRVAPKEKDILSINKFLKYFSTELSEPTDLWNEETRNELKSLLIEQIMTIYKSSGR